MDFIKVRNLCYDTIYDKTAQTAYIDQTEDLSPEHVKNSLIRRPIVMYGCESWTVKKAEHQELMPCKCGAGGRRLLRVQRALWAKYKDQTSQS